MKKIMLSLLVAVTLILSLKDITSQIVEFTGERNVNGTYGGNVTIGWNTRAKPIDNLGLHIIAGDSNGETLMSLFVDIRATSQSIDFPLRSSTLNIISRVFARYTSTGNADSDGKVIGQVLFTITNLKFSDNGSYTIAEGIRKPFTITTQTELSVFHGPEQCGTPLKSEYIINSGENLTLSTGSCGKPQPTVTCKFDGKSYASVNVTEVNQYNYTYTFVIPTNLKPCEKKQLSCTATGYGKPVTEDVTILGNFDSSFGRFIGNLKFQRDYRNCSTVFWKKEVDTGKCDVCYQLKFLNGTNTATATAFSTEEIFNDCDLKGILESESVRIRTFVGNISVCGNKSRLDELPNSRIITATITTTLTSTSDSLKCDEKLSKNEKELRSKTVIIIALVVVLTVLAMADLLLFVLVKIGKVEMKLISHKSCENSNMNQHCQENIQDVNTVMKPQSDYMELQAARKDTTYQALTSVQSTPAAAKKNSLYEI